MSHTWTVLIPDVGRLHDPHFTHVQHAPKLPHTPRSSARLSRAPTHMPPTCHPPACRVRVHRAAAPTHHTRIHPPTLPPMDIDMDDDVDDEAPTLCGRSTARLSSAPPIQSGAVRPHPSRAAPHPSRAAPHPSRAAPCAPTQPPRSGTPARRTRRFCSAPEASNALRSGGFRRAPQTRVIRRIVYERLGRVRWTAMGVPPSLTKLEARSDPSTAAPSTVILISASVCAVIGGSPCCV